MLKKVLFISFLSGTSLFATNNSYIIGIGYESSKLEAKANDNNTGGKINGGKIIFGKEYSKKRLSLSHSYHKKDLIKINTTLINQDYFLIDKTPSLYLGYHVGYVQYDESVTFLQSTLGQKPIKINGLAYGLQIGALFKPSKKLNVDLAYRYSMYEAKKTVKNIAIQDDVYELIDFNTLSLSINYSF